MKNVIKKLNIFIILAIIIVSFSGCSNNKEIQKITEQEQTLEQFIKENGQEIKIDKVDISNWQIYKNEEYAFQVKYPNNWSHVSDSDEDSKNFVIGYEECAGEYDYYGSPNEKCNNSVVIVISNSSDENLMTRSGWGWALSTETQKNDYCDDIIPLELNTDIPFSSCTTNEFGYIHYRYFVENDEAKYLLTIRYAKDDHDPIIEKEILESFEFIEK